MSTALVGKVVYRLHLGQGKKTEKKTEIPSSSSDVEITSGPPMVGWIFQPTTTKTTNTVSAQYLLSVPRNLLKMVCDACRFHQTLRIKQRVSWPISMSTATATTISAAGFAAAHNDNNNRLNVAETNDANLFFLELTCEDGLEIVDEPKNCLTGGTGKDEDDTWTLAQLARMEAVDKAQKLPRSLSSNKESHYTLRASVNAVSPIITINPKDPFCLLEMYCEESTHSAVAILLKTALQCQAAILPGDTITLRNVRRQKWRTPETLAKNNYFEFLEGDRVPTHVFVVNDDKAIGWWDEKPQFPVPFVPPYPLTTIKGYVSAVHRIYVEHIEHLHYIELVLCSSSIKEQEEDQTECGLISGFCVSLYLTYFPMSSSLLLSLQKREQIVSNNNEKGLIVEATNVHRMDASNYAACLRSSITIIQSVAATAPVASGEISVREDWQTQPETVSDDYFLNPNYLSLKKAVPYPFLQIKRNYMELCLRQRLSTWIESQRIPPLLKRPSLDDLVHSLIPATALEFSARNPYAEFFHHGVEATNHSEKVIGCDLSCHEHCGLQLPQLLNLGRIHEISFDILKAKLKRHIADSSKTVKVGWTGSVLVSAEDLACACGLNSRAPAQKIYTGGVAELTCDSGTTYCNVTNGHFTFPATSKCLDKMCSQGRGQFLFASVAHVALSCLCIGPLEPSKTSGEADASSEKVFHLPPYNDQGTCNAKYGPSILLQTDGLLFVACLCLYCDVLLPVKQEVTAETAARIKMQCSGPGGLLDFSVRNVLDPAVTENEQPSHFVGLLTRKFYRPSAARNGNYMGCLLTVSQAPSDHLLEDKLMLEEVSCLQSIDIKGSLRIENSKRNLIRRFFGNSMGANVADDKVTLVCVWWKLGGCPKSCLLLGGGWDEVLPGADWIAKSRGILVSVPVSALKRDERHGFVRGRCRLEEISCSIRSFGKRRQWRRMDSLPSSALDFVGGIRFLPGMLDRRPARRHLGANGEASVSPGQLLVPPSDAGIPLCTLADLHWAICSDLNKCSRVEMAPSLVREIHGTFMGVMFCRVMAECTKCFSPLCDPSPKAERQVKKAKKNNEKADASDEIAENWHLPKSIYSRTNKQSGMGNDVPSDSVGKDLSCDQLSTQAQQNHQPHKTVLQCPNCKIKRQGGAIKWECSGKLDDGTGQARMYAERDAAVTLLGLSPLEVKLIEDGAWLCENGIVFSRTIPPKPYLREAILIGKTHAHKHERTQEKGGEAVLNFLSPIARAEYLIQSHCRSLEEHFCDRIYYVRCKPLSDEVRHLSQTNIELAVPGDTTVTSAVGTRDAASYSLPPLKVNLIDCCANHA